MDMTQHRDERLEDAERAGPQEAAIRLEAISKKFATQTAIEHLNLQVHKGEFVTLLGPSGSGKTTTLMIVSGHEMPTEGRVYIDGDDVTALPPYRRRIGMVFQHYAIFPHMTVAQNIAFPLRMHRIPKDQVPRMAASAIEMVRLRGLDSRYPSQLSGGQLQRVALARALVFRPSILLMDEPLSALDKQLRDSMQLEIRRLQQELRIPTLYVTHDQREALVLSDRVAVFNHGRIVQIGTPTELYEHPQSRFVAEFIGESNFLAGEIVSQRAGICRIRLSDGTEICAPSQRTFSDKEEVVVSVRPEAIELSLTPPTGNDSLNVLPATIEQAIYSGDSRRVVAKTGSAVAVVVNQRNSGLQVQVIPGQCVVLAWTYSKTNIMPKEEQGHV